MSEKRFFNKNTKVILTLVLLLITVIGATYAYFVAQKGSGASAEINVEAGTTDSLTFNNEDNEILINANQDNFGSNDQSLTDTAQVSAHLIANNNTFLAHETYNIFLVVENNDLEYTNGNNPELLFKIIDPTGKEYITTIDGLKHYENITDKDGQIYQGYDITTSTNQVYKIVSDYEITATEEDGNQAWQVEVSLINLGNDQNANTGKTFQGSVYITSEKDLKLTEVNTLSTELNEDSLTATIAATNGTNKIKNYYFALEKTDELPSEFKTSSIANALAQDYSLETEASHVFNEEIMANQNYKIYAYAVDELGYYSNIYETVVTAKDGVIPTVENVSVTQDYQSITLNFANQDGLSYREKIDNGDWTEFQSEATHTFANLNLNSYHKIEVQVKNSDELVSNVKSLFASTLTYESPKINSIDLSDYTFYGVTAKANVEAGSEEISQVEFMSSQDNKWYQGTKNEDGTYSYTFVNLSPEVEYTITAKATSVGLQGTSFETVKATTLADSREVQNLKDFIVAKAGESVGSDGETLAIHSSLTNSAEDGSYRYSGNNPNNFVCFGAGSEKYNSGLETSCPDTNLYRIIGVFGNQVKLIKSEYINKDELGLGDKEYGESDNPINIGVLYKSLARVNNKENIHSFYWSGTLLNASNVWAESDLFKALNNADSTHYLGNLGAHWAKKIALTNWHAGGVEDVNHNPKEMYDLEVASATVSAKVGLMYASDYGYAASSASWGKSLSTLYDDITNRHNNWLYNGVSEWTITPRTTSLEHSAFNVDADGKVLAFLVNVDSRAVRPAFYLDNEVKVIVDNTLGSSSSPFRIQV